MSVMDKNLHDFLGYAKMSKFVSKSPFVSMGAKTVYTNFKQYAFENVDSEVFPARETIAAELGCHVNTLDKYIKELKELGLMNVIRQGVKRPNLYELEEINLELIFNVLKPKLNAKEIDKLNKYIRSKRLHKVYEIKGDSQYIVNHESEGDSQHSVSQESHATVSQESQRVVSKKEQIEKEQDNKNKKVSKDTTQSVDSKKELKILLSAENNHYKKYLLKMDNLSLLDTDKKAEFGDKDFFFFFLAKIEEYYEEGKRFVQSILQGAHVYDNQATSVCMRSFKTLLSRFEKRSEAFAFIDEITHAHAQYKGSQLRKEEFPYLRPDIVHQDWMIAELHKSIGKKKKKVNEKYRIAPVTERKKSITSEVEEEEVF